MERVDQCVIGTTMSYAGLFRPLNHRGLCSPSAYLRRQAQVSQTAGQAAEPLPPNERRRDMKSLVWVVLAGASLLAGCGSVGLPATPGTGVASSVADNASPVTGRATPVTGNTAFEERAAMVAKAWQGGVLTAWTHGLVPLQELSVEPVVSPKGTTRDFETTYSNGCIRIASPLPDTTGRGDVQFADGTSMPVPLVGAQTAYNRLPKRSANCPMADQPPWLTITSARLSTVEILTSRGQAVVPAWRYAVTGLSQPLIGVAVAPSAITSLPQMTLREHSPRDGLVSAGGLISGEGDVVTFRVGIGACDKDLQALVWETPEVIVVGGSVTLPEAGMPCAASQLSRRADVRTKQPIGERLIVDSVSGRPLLTFPWSLGP
jgi:hypothetical protein